MTSLMINGDDFGMNERCSRAIVHAFEEGLITHTSMMANGEYYAEAITLIRGHRLSEKIGIHFNLTEGEPLTEDIRRIPEFVADGRFHKQYLKDPRPLSGAEQEAVYRELSAQAEKLSASGIILSHADSHHYIHNLTFLAPVAAAVCREYHIGRVRLNRTFDTLTRPRITENRISNSWWREQGFETADHFGRLSDITDAAIPESTEIMVHPDYDKNGALIDRTGTVGGFPTGSVLSRIAEILAD